MGSALGCIHPLAGSCNLRYSRTDGYGTLGPCGAGATPAFSASLTSSATESTPIFHFPISKTVTGEVLDLDPGGLRELHWHPSADEWQYVIEGQINVTMFGSHGRFRAEDLEKGDVAYVPQGYGYSIENTGDNPCRV
jgi:mannose-6-phosphate isomerase-like protein (cupin superfamily)